MVVPKISLVLVLLKAPCGSPVLWEIPVRIFVLQVRRVESPTLLLSLTFNANMMQQNTFTW